MGITTINTYVYHTLLLAMLITWSTAWVWLTGQTFASLPTPRTQRGKAAQALSIVFVALAPVVAANAWAVRSFW
jgi:hypothetical protein